MYKFRSDSKRVIIFSLSKKYSRAAYLSSRGDTPSHYSLSIITTSRSRVRLKPFPHCIRYHIILHALHSLDKLYTDMICDFQMNKVRSRSVYNYYNNSNNPTYYILYIYIYDVFRLMYKNNKFTYYKFSVDTK